MIDTDGRPHGKCGHTGYAEFDSLTGYVTANYTYEWQDKRGTRWRKQVIVTNLGRPDRGIPVDPDVLIADEYMPVGKGAQMEARYRASLAATQERRHGEVLRALGAYMAEHGPAKLQALLPVTGWRDDQTLTEHLRMFPGVYLCYRLVPQVWGLHGQTYVPQGGERSVHTRIWDALLEHGPQTATELSKRVGSAVSSCNNTLRNDKGVTFVRVAMRPGEFCGTPAAVWGLA